MTESDKRVFDAVDKLAILYSTSDVCIGELLATTVLDGYTIEETVRIYSILYSKIEEDMVLRINLEECSCIDLKE